MKWENHIVSDPAILLGKPVIKGTRISVETILELYGQGWSEASILESYPHISHNDLLAVFGYVNDCVRLEQFLPLPKSA